MRPFLPSLLIALLLGCGGDSKPPPAPAGVSLYKSAGSVQCTGGGVSVQEMERQLTGAGIKVLSSACGSDGKMYPSMCGSPDGRIGIVEVPDSQVQAAAKMGFAPLSDSPDATKVPCQ